MLRCFIGKWQKQAPVDGIKKVLLMLAEDEVHHRIAIEISAEEDPR